jgi:hypothetical protein
MQSVSRRVVSQSDIKIRKNSHVRSPSAGALSKHDGRDDKEMTAMQLALRSHFVAGTVAMLWMAFSSAQRQLRCGSDLSLSVKRYLL